jgi:CHAT domain-containing protein
VILSGDGSYKLYASDVLERPLAADLVTISACRSAGERTYAGEGLVGFAWAFLRAGARRVIAGLWDVDDRSTAELMERLYGALAGGASPSAALRAAKRAAIKGAGAGAKPYYWAPFEVFVGAGVVP